MSIIIDVGTSGPSVPILASDWYIPPSVPTSNLFPRQPLKQSLLNVFKDVACTNRVSEHWDDSADTNPISTIKPLAIPFAGTLESDTTVVYLKCAERFKTEGLVEISINDIYRTQSSEYTDNRWMISLNPYLEGEFWGNTIYIERAIAAIPIPIYIKARTMGPPHTSFTASRDAISLDYSVHLMIYAQIVLI